MFESIWHTPAKFCANNITNNYYILFKLDFKRWNQNDDIK